MTYDPAGHTVVTEADIVAGLRALGLESGDMVQVHSALSSFGYVDGGAEAVVDAFLKALGPEGTLMVPTFNHQSREAFDDEHEIFDRETTRSVNGAVTEAVRLRPEAHRSLHPTHPYAAIGPKAEWLTSEHLDLKTFDRRSPLGKLVEGGGKICMFGVGMNACTAAHVAETRAGSRCMGYRRLVRKVRLPDGEVIDARAVLWRGEGTCKLEWQAIEGELRMRGIIRDRRIGEAMVMLFDGAEMVDATFDLALRMCPTCEVRPRPTGTRH
ncbi:MAG: aminoglycoside N(3)-acetyltransferase [Armatimonadota bacterium]